MSLPKPRTLALLTTLIAGAALPAAASADPLVFTDYDVLIEGSGTYALHAESGPAGGRFTEDIGADFTFRTHLPKVTFTNNTPGQGAGTSVLTVNSASRRTVLENVNETDTLTCAANPGPLDAFGGALLKSAVRTAPGGESGIDIDVVGSGLEIPIPTCDGPTGDGAVMPIRLWDRPEAFRQFFTFPHEIVGFGKVIQLIGKTSTGEGCPGLRANTTSCTLTWNATVTFDRTGRTVLGAPAPAPAADDDDIFVPIPVGAGAPPADDDDIFVPIPVGAGAPPAADDDDIFVPIPLRSSIAPDASTAKTSFACAVACTGTVTVTALRRGSKAGVAAKARPLATRRFRGRAGKPVRLTLRLDGKARRAARRAGGVRVTVVAKAKGGTPVRKVVALKLRRR